MVKVGIAGGSGYGGLELIHVLLRHPHTDLVWISSERYAGRPASELYPHLSGFLDLAFSPLEAVIDADLDVLFLSLPHGEAMKLVPRLRGDLIVIDLSGDFRINDPKVFEKYYGFPHACMDCQKDFVYGLTEINRSRLKGARRISNPGCFATATLLGLYPLYREQWIDGPVFVDAKTGSSGSGRSPSASTHHPRRSQSLFPYKPLSHQHLAEMFEILDTSSNPLVFQTYSVPLVRGIFASHYLRTKTSVSPEDVRQLFIDYYGDEPFIRWVSGCPDVSSVSHSNFVDIGATTDGSHLIIWSTIDNLQKGAAGQAVQNMNLACGFPETTGLLTTPLFP